jgi:effector-binding domain-containing protein
MSLLFRNKNNEAGWFLRPGGGSMKKALIIFLVLAAGLGLAWGQEVRIEDNTPFTYVYLEGSGSYQQISAKMTELFHEVGRQELPMDAPFGLYLNSPQEVKSEAELEWLVGMPVGPKVPVAAPLKKGEFNFIKVARCLYTGPYDQVASAYGKVMQFIEANGYRAAGPVMEQYLNDPMTVPAAELQTEIIVPVEKK